MKECPTLQEGEEEEKEVGEGEGEVQHTSQGHKLRCI